MNPTEILSKLTPEQRELLSPIVRGRVIGSTYDTVKQHLFHMNVEPPMEYAVDQKVVIPNNSLTKKRFDAIEFRRLNGPEMVRSVIEKIIVAIMIEDRAVKL